MLSVLFFIFTQVTLFIFFYFYNILFHIYIFQGFEVCLYIVKCFIIPPVVPVHVIIVHFNPFYVSSVYLQIFLKDCGKRNNFSFSHMVFYPFGELSATFIKFESDEKSLKSEESNICRLLTHYHTMQLKIYSCGKHCEKKGEITCNKQLPLSHNVLYPN